MNQESARRLPADLRQPHPTRLDPARPDYAEIIRRHEAALSRGESFYLDPSTGAMVFTAQALWDRDSCCDSGCRHCPYIQPRHA